MEQVAVKPRDVMPEGARTLPARYYTDPSLLKAELDGLFGTMWFYAGRSEEAQRPGQYFVRELNGHNIVVTRNASGEVRAFHNICRHRGTRICDQATGQFAGSIQCPYHAWTYDLDGRLIGAPHMNEVPHFKKADYPLLAVHAAEWDGHVFLNLSESPEPLGAQLGPLVGEVPQLEHAGPAARPPDRLRRQGELEADHPELQRVPALPQPASGAQQSLALPERRERAAAGDLHGRAHGSPAGRRHAVDGRHLPARRSSRASPTRTGAASTTTASSRT